MTDLTTTAVNLVPEFQKGGPNVQSFFTQLGAFLDEIGATIAGFQDYSDYINMSQANLSNFVQEKGITFPRNMSLSQRQKLAKDVVNLHRATGTIKAMQFMFNIIGLQVQIQYAWLKRSDMLSQPPAPYNYVFGSLSTPQGDGVTVVGSGAYFQGADTFGVPFSNVTIVGENYTSAQLTGQINNANTADAVIKLPYIRITVTSQNYNTFTQDYIVDGVNYSYTTGEQFLITQEILNYFLGETRPANVAIIEISTPFNLSDLLPYAFDTANPILNIGTGNGSTVTWNFPTGWRTDATVYKSDWQGNQLQYATPRTNLQTDSNTFTAWTDSISGTGTAPVVTASYAVGPDGITGSASRLQLNQGTGVTGTDYCYLVSPIVTSSANQSYTESIWIKSNTAGSQPITLAFRGADKQTYTVGTAWQRIINTQTPTFANAGIYIGQEGDISHAVTGDFLVAFSQFESGSTVTSYIPTTTSAVTVTDYSLSTTQITFASAPVMGAVLTAVLNSYSLNDEGLTSNTVNVGWVWDGTVTLDIPMDRYLLGETFGGFEFGVNTMTLYPAPTQATVNRTYDFRNNAAANNLVVNGNPSYLGTNLTVPTSDEYFQLSSGSNLPFGWNLFQGSATISYPITGMMFGNQLLQMVATNTSPVILYTNVQYPVNPGDTVTLLSTAAYNGSSAGYGSVLCEWYQENGTPCSPANFANTYLGPSTLLSTKVSSGVAPANTAYFQLAVQMNPSVVGDTVQFNHVHAMVNRGGVTPVLENWTAQQGGSQLQYSLTAGNNFSPAFTFQASGYDAIFGDAAIPFNSNHVYKVHYNLKSSVASDVVYLGVAAYDANGNFIPPHHAWRNPIYNTTLYSPIHVGDTNVYITKVGSGWPLPTDGAAIQFNIVSNYLDLPNSSAVFYSAINTSNSAYDILTIASSATAYPAGTPVGYSNGGSGSYTYCSAVAVMPPGNVFSDFSGKLHGVNPPTSAPMANQAPIGTAFIRPLMLLDYSDLNSFYTFQAIDILDLDASPLPLQIYVPTRGTEHVTLVTRPDSTVSLVGSKDNRVTLASGTPSWQSLVTQTGKAMYAGASITFGNTSGHDTITRATGSWITDGFVVGDQIQVLNTASSGIYAVYAITDTVLTLTSNGKVGIENTTAATVTNCYDGGILGYFAVAVNINEPSLLGTTTLAVVQSES